MTTAGIAASQSRAWMWAAYGLFMVIALSFLALYLVDLRLDYIQIQYPCSGAECNWMAISEAEMTILESWGFSPRAYALIMTGGTVLIVAVYWLLGGIILWLQRNRLLGFAVSLALLIIPIAMVADPDNVAANYPALELPSFILRSLGGLVFLLFIYLFPNGRFVARWSALAFISSVIILLFTDMAFAGLFSMEPAVQQLLIIPFTAVILFGGGSQIYRYLRVSTPIERMQTKWVVLGLLITLLAVPIWAIVYGGIIELPSGEVRIAAVLANSLNPLVFALPITAAIAIQRYRLWDIDLIIRKTVIYSLLTGSLVLFFFGSVVLLQSLLGVIIGDRNTTLVTVVSTLAVAALFNPLRRRIQALIDRRFYRQRYDTEKILAGFSSSLRDEVDLDRLQKSILGVVDKTMKPTSVTLWMRDTNISLKDEKPAG